MKKFFSVIFLYSYCSTSYSQPVSYFQQQVNYNINVTLTDADNTLDGFEKIDYTNNSPDTLHYIWFHLWPNAFKNDRTAFSDQELENGKTNFYFSSNDKRGFINRLDFTVNGITARLEDHPQYIDIVKLILPLPLTPGKTIHIATPFHEKIPFNFSRGGHVEQAFQITQWYPKPAVYDRKGWHPMPYLDQGEFYSEFGNFDVSITVPKDYVVAATGELQNATEKEWLMKRSKEKFTEKRQQSSGKPRETKTLRFVQDNIHDFAWFADKSFLLRTDTLQLESGRIINVYSFFTSSGYNIWKNSPRFIKGAVRTRSEWLGEYPYNIVTAVEAQMGFNGGMEYPTITSISPATSEKDLDLTIEHEVGHNWNYGILATNERDHPWMDEGMNTYFDNRYLAIKYPKAAMTDLDVKPGFLKKRIPDDVTDLLYRSVIAEKTDQPIETVSEKFSEFNYNLIAYYKTGLWMKQLENYVGKDVFDKCLHEYFNRWKFKHPYPEDFEKVVEDVSGKNVDVLFSLLNKPGELEPGRKKDTRLAAFFNFRDNDKHNYIFIAPAIGLNHYDKLMIGGLIHNYTFPENRFGFLAAPMYATGSKKITGLARVEYNWLSYGTIRRIKLSLSAASFSMNEFTDSAGNTKYLGFRKITPSLKLVFREKNPRSSVTKYLQWKTFLISEDELLFTRDTSRQIDVISYPKTNRYLNQLRYVVENNRVLYPYAAEFEVEQAKDFARATFTGNYFLNYIRGGGLSVRLFAGKFIYLGDKTFVKQFETEPYQLDMTGPKGYEDYTYSNYFTGRNEFEKFSSQQIMIRDGGFKVRTDLLSSKVGKTDDWLAAVNFKADLSEKLNSIRFVKLFFDVGTYADAWKSNPPSGRFLYDGGVQVSLINNLVNFYIPLVYSKVYSDYFKSTLGNNRFWKNISFSIDIQNFSLRKFNKSFSL